MVVVSEPNTKSLMVLRALFAAVVAAVVAIGVAVAILGDMKEGDDEPTGVALAIVAGVGCLTLLLRRVVSRPLDPSSPASLAASYRTRLILRLAVAESAALIAFAIGMSLGPWWVYYLGAAFAFVGMAMAAPTQRNLGRDQDALSLAGHELSLLDALSGPP